MKVLVVSWGWYPTGGDWTYVENVIRLYKEQGHQVVALSTQNERNIACADENHYFIPSDDFKQLNKNKNIRNGIKAVKNSIVNANAIDAVDKILERHDIKLAHFHNIHHYVTPAIIWKLNKKGVKIMWTLHDYKIICPENSFVSNGQVCEKCITGQFYRCATNKCKKQSFLASSLAAIDAYFYHGSGTYGKVDKFLCPSEFMLTKFRQFGFKEEQLALTNYCYDIELVDEFIRNNPPAAGTSPFIFYVGRIEEIKGVKTLIDAVGPTQLQLKIAGTGTALEEMKLYVIQKGITNVEFLGFQNKESVFRLTQNAKFAICPSEWYENFPFSVTETFLFSKPVIGSRMGGIPELVIDGETGLLFEHGNVEELRTKLLYLWDNDALAIQFGANARKHAEQIFNFKTHWIRLGNVLKELGLY